MSTVCACPSPAQQLRVGEDLLQTAVVADAEGEDGLSRVTGKVPGDTCREGKDHFTCDLHHTSAKEGKRGKNKSQTKKKYASRYHQVCNGLALFQFPPTGAQTVVSNKCFPLA